LGRDYSVSRSKGGVVTRLRRGDRNPRFNFWIGRSRRTVSIGRHHRAILARIFDWCRNHPVPGASESPEGSRGCSQRQVLSDSSIVASIGRTCHSRLVRYRLRLGRRNPYRLYRSCNCHVDGSVAINGSTTWLAVLLGGTLDCTGRLDLRRLRRWSWRISVVGVYSATTRRYTVRPARSRNAWRWARSIRCNPLAAASVANDPGSWPNQMTRSRGQVELPQKLGRFMRYAKWWPFPKRTWLLFSRCTFGAAAAHRMVAAPRVGGVQC
jgi:hypothetical protein